jgi:lipopolysaccharide/colanic/teichoic acid biosynthesis glycosyltransferase
MSQGRLDSNNSMSKRVFDVVLASLALIVAAPVFLVVALSVKVFGGTGPVIFRGARIGVGSELFDIFKFRSMKLGSETGAQLTAGEDPRITRVGRILRATKLDELPQLWNVLRGDMSFVGPRPEAPKYVQYYTDEQRRLLQVRPGITSVASLEYRNEAELLGQVAPEDREAFYLRQLLPLQLDLELSYLRDWKLRRDISILWRTALAIVVGFPAAHVDGQARMFDHDRRVIGLSRRTCLLVGLDLVAWGTGLITASVFRHGQILGNSGENLVVAFAVVAVLQVAFGNLFGMYRARFAVGRFDEVGAVATSFVAVVAGYFVLHLVAHWVPVGRGNVVFASYWALVPSMGARYLFRYWRGRRIAPPAPHSRRVLVVGAGAGAQALVPALAFDPTSRYRPVGILDDDPNKRQRQVAGVRVVGMIDDLAYAAKKMSVDAIVISIPSAPAELVFRVTAAAHGAGLDVVVPGVLLNPGVEPLHGSDVSSVELR